MFPFYNYKDCRVTCIFGKPGDWKSGKHDGIDIVSDGNKTVLAVAPGKIIRSGWNDSWGNYIVLQMTGGKSLVYAHLAAGSRKVLGGDTVKEGDALGIMGSTGNSSGPHLHIELQNNYYTCGDVSDIAAFLGIKNTLGEVQKLATVSKPASWAADASGWAVKNGLIQGDENGDCKWQNPVTREELAVIMQRLYSLIK